MRLIEVFLQHVVIVQTTYKFRLILKIQANSESRMWEDNSDNTMKLYKDLSTLLSTQHDKVHAIFTLKHKHA